MDMTECVATKLLVLISFMSINYAKKTFIPM